MKVASIIVFVAIAVFLVWFTYDTVKFVIKKVKAKKEKKKQDSDVKEIDTTK